MAKFKVATSDVERLLSGYRPSSEDERLHVLAVLDLLRATEAPFCRHQFEPGHITSSAVVHRDDGTVLMINHSKLMRWLQPGGHIEAEDTSLEAAAVREVAEETSLDVSHEGAVLIDVDVHEIPARKPVPAHLHFDLRFQFDLGSLRPNILAKSDASDTDWRLISRVLSETDDLSITRMLSKIRLLK